MCVGGGGFPCHLLILRIDSCHLSLGRFMTMSICQSYEFFHYLDKVSHEVFYTSWETLLLFCYIIIITEIMLLLYVHITPIFYMSRILCI